MIVRQVVLVYVRVGVLAFVAVRVRVFVLEMVMVVTGVRMRVREFVVLVFVGVRRVVAVLILCHCRLLAVRDTDDVHCALRRRALCALARLGRFAPVARRAWGVEQCSWAFAQRGLGTCQW